MATHEAPKDSSLETNGLDLPRWPDVVPDMDDWLAEAREYQQEKFQQVCERLFELGINHNHDSLYSIPTENGFYRVYFTNNPINITGLNGEASHKVHGQRIIINSPSEEYDGQRSIKTHDYLIRFDTAGLSYTRSQVELMDGKVDTNNIKGPLIIYRAGRTQLAYGNDYKEKFVHARFRQSHTSAMDRLLEQLAPLSEATRDELY